MAFPATQLELVTELFINDRWVDVTGDVRTSDGVTISHGSASQDRTVPPAKCNLTLKNTSDKYNRRNPLSPNFGLLGRNTPLRVSRGGLAADTFTARTVSNGWGTSSHGEVWSIQNNGGTAADFAVSGGVGTHTVGVVSTSRLSYLAGVVHRDVDVSATVTLPFSNVTGGDLEPLNLMMRGTSTTSYLMVRLVINTSEQVTIKIMDSGGTNYSSTVTVPGLTHTAAQSLRVRAQAEGTTVRAKVWAVSTSVANSTGEPLGWHVEGTVPGAPVAGWVGIRSGVASGNTNVPVVFSYTNFEVRSNRGAFEVSSWPPQWDLSEADRRMPIEGAGIMRRLGQGDSPLRSTLRRSIPTLPDLVAYWPMEDGKEADSLASALPTGLPMTIDGDHSLSSYTGFASSEAIPTIGSTIWRGKVAPYTGTGQVQTRWIMHMSPDGVSLNNLIHRVWTSGTVAFWDISGGTTPGSLKITANTGSAEILNQDMGFDLRDLNGRMSLELKQNGSNIDWGVWFLEVDASGAGGFTGTVNNQTISAALQVDFSLTGNLDGSAIGHATAEKAVTSVFNLNAQLNAYNGEAAATRLARLCSEEGVPLSINGEQDADALMGPQLPATLLDLLSDCADVDLGILGESRGTLALKYRTRLSMTNQAAIAAIDYAAKELAPPFEPTDDDRFTANDITAKRTNGSSYRATLDSGPLSVQNPPNGAGRYDTGIEVNCRSDQQLPHIAGWLLALGTVDQYRIASVAINLANAHVVANGSLVAGALSLDLGDRVTIDSLSSVGIYDQVSQLVPGYTETLGPFEHKIEANAVPATPYRVLVLDDASFGLLDSESSTLTSNISSSAGSFQLSTVNTGDLWTTDPADFPLDITVDGERIRLSAISGSSSPQTCTVASGGRAINGVTKAHNAGAEVHIASPNNLA